MKIISKEYTLIQVYSNVEYEFMPWVHSMANFFGALINPRNFIIGSISNADFGRNST